METKEIFIRNKTRLSKAKLLEEYFLIASSNEALQKNSDKVQGSLDRAKELETEITRLSPFEKKFNDLKGVKDDLDKEILRLTEENTILKSDDKEQVIKERDNTIEELTLQCQDLAKELSKVIDAWELSLKLNQTANDSAVNNFSNIKENILKKWGNK